MALEEQILRYYLVLFSLFFLFFLYFANISVIDDNKIIKIDKGMPVNQVSNKIFSDKEVFKKKLFNSLLILSDKYFYPVNYGQFEISKDASYFEIIKTISSKSNVDYKVTIVEGWQVYQLNNYLKDFYKINTNINYNEALAETYIINSSNSLGDLKAFTLKMKNNFFKKYENNSKIKKFGVENILIISSLVEKEAKNDLDKGLIASVIFNRLSKQMKLQIDASVIYAITGGLNNLDRKLTYADLKIKHPFNTYYIKKLPPGMICYVSPRTIELVLESVKSDFLFYFYNIIDAKHIFSKTYNEHKNKLSEYRKKNK